TLRFGQSNEKIKSPKSRNIAIETLLGQRYTVSGCTGKANHISGIPGNALGAYLTECDITVYGNAQDAVGDAMNDGTITIHGNVGDAAGYGMRDGKILVKGSAGYRAGIHMKEYMEKKPLMVIGGKTGDFLAEYQAGGKIIVLGIGHEKECPVGDFCATGMHGGVMYIRSEHKPDHPAQVLCEDATKDDIKAIKADIELFAKKFDFDAQELLDAHFFKLTPNTNSPYRRLYVNN
ncbi:MAG: glutamate synthase, partial [Lachnospiraceae bacterium]|nr:glutamate synthase [Lachnospiraceae bacterium]